MQWLRQRVCHSADGAAEFFDQRIKRFLLKETGTKVTWSSTDTPELNAESGNTPFLYYTSIV